MTQEEHDDLLADAINGLLDDLQQDVIAELKYQFGGDSGHEWDNTYGWNKALEWVTDRLHTYRKE